MLQKDTIKIFIEISPFFGVKTSKTFKAYNDIQGDSWGEIREQINSLTNVLFHVYDFNRNNSRYLILL